VIGDGITVGRWLIPENELEERFDTSGGPGGQHANRNETAVTLRFDVSASSLPESVKERLTRKLGDRVEVVAADTRSQMRNRERARERLAQKLESGLAEPRPRKRTKPSKQATARRLEEKRARSEVKRQRRKPGLD
jgi:ribosome-associated protein